MSGNEAAGEGSVGKGLRNSEMVVQEEWRDMVAEKKRGAENEDGDEALGPVWELEG